MKINIFFISVLFLFISFTGEWKQVRVIPTDARFMTADQFGNVYLITKGNVIRKIAEDENELSFTDGRFARFTYLDVSNPLKVLAFAPEFSTIVMLDSRLAELGRLNLMEQGLTDLSAIAASNDNYLWVYDQLDARLKKLDLNGTVLSESNDLRTLGVKVGASRIYPAGDKVFVVFPTTGILVFDHSAAYYKTIHWPAVHELQVADEQLYILNADHSGGIYDGDLLKEEKFEWPVDSVVSFNLRNNQFYLLTSDGVEIWRKSE